MGVCVCVYRCRVLTYGSVYIHICRMKIIIIYIMVRYTCTTEADRVAQGILRFFLNFYLVPSVLEFCPWDLRLVPDICRF